MPEFEPNWRGDLSRYGMVGAWSDWRVVLEQYNQDHLEAAHRLAEEFGAGPAGMGIVVYRRVDAEYLTRVRSTTEPVNDWLTLEWVPDELAMDDSMRTLMLDAMDSVAKRLGYETRGKVLLSVLTTEADAPWSDGRFGYMVNKIPFDKICVPLAAFGSRERLHEVVAHEYAHVIAHDLSEGRVPRWMDEAIAMVMQSGDRPHRVDHWLTPDELDMAYHADQGDVRRWNAYQQSGIIGEFLATMGGEPKIGELLRDFANNSTWTELKMSLTGQRPEDEALREAYGFGVQDLFSNAEVWQQRRVV